MNNIEQCTLVGWTNERTNERLQRVTNIVNNLRLGILEIELLPVHLELEPNFDLWLVIWEYETTNFDNLELTTATDRDVSISINVKKTVVYTHVNGE